MDCKNSHRARDRSRARGFTLIELMIVVAVIGLLSAVAIPSFSGYLYRSRVSEGVGFLGDMKQREESYRSEFGQYVATGWNPATQPGTSRGTFDPALENLGSNESWPQLGSAPDMTSTFFSFRTRAGAPGAAPATATLAVPAPTNDFWFYAEACANLDGDSTYFVLQTYSHNSTVFMGQTGTERDLATPSTSGKGWE